jgi:hypothetical protein
VRAVSVALRRAVTTAYQRNQSPLRAGRGPRPPKATDRSSDTCEDVRQTYRLKATRLTSAARCEIKPVHARFDPPIETD